MHLKNLEIRNQSSFSQKSIINLLNTRKNLKSLIFFSKAKWTDGMLMVLIKNSPDLSSLTIKPYPKKPPELQQTINKIKAACPKLRVVNLSNDEGSISKNSLFSFFQQKANSF